MFVEYATIFFQLPDVSFAKCMGGHLLSKQSWQEMLQQPNFSTTWNWGTSCSGDISPLVQLLGTHHPSTPPAWSSVPRKANSRPSHNEKVLTPRLPDGKCFGNTESDEKKMSWLFIFLALRRKNGEYFTVIVVIKIAGVKAWRSQRYFKTIFQL